MGYVFLNCVMGGELPFAWCSGAAKEVQLLQCQVRIEGHAVSGQGVVVDAKPRLGARDRRVAIVQTIPTQCGVGM